VGFFDWINRWQVVVAAAVIVAGLDFGIYLGVHHSRQLDTSLVSSLFEGRRSDAPVEDAVPRGSSKEPPQRSTPSANESQYGP
jgi:hypothetical protein